jgi:hypothetical protein
MFIRFAWANVSVWPAAEEIVPFDTLIPFFRAIPHLWNYRAHHGHNIPSLHDLEFSSLKHNCLEALLTINNRTATISPGFTFLVKDSNVKIKSLFE